MAIEAVLFDYSGVLTTGLHMPTENVPFDPDLVFAEMAVALSSPDANPWHELERGEITLDAYCDYVDGLVPHASALFRVDSEHNVMAQLTMLEDRLAVAARLKADGMSVGLVTNNVAEWEPHWRPRLPADLFEVVIDSAQVGCRKPEAAIYELALAQLNVANPGTALFIDDFEWNVQGALDAGLRGLHCPADLDLGAAVDELIRRSD